MFGPPGTGKTMLAKAVATECNSTFFNITTSSLTSKYVGDVEKLVKLLFDMASFYSPSIIFIDEIDAVCSTRGGMSEHEASRKVKSQILTEMDGLSSNQDIFLLGATNLPWDIDSAVLRRLPKRLYIGLPNRKAIQALVEKSFADIQLEEGFVCDELVPELEGYSGSDIKNICRDASLMGMRRKIHGLPKEE